MTELTIADRPDQADASWLTNALRTTGRLDDAQVSSVEMAPLGTGQMCDSFRLRLRYDGTTDLPDSMVAKFPSASEGSRNAAAAMSCYEKEVRFYQTLADELPVNTPQSFYAAIGEDTTSFTLLLEDRSPATQGDQIAGCSPEVAHAAVIELANLHGPRWGDTSLGELPWIAQPTADQRALLNMMLPMFWTEFLARYGDAVEPPLRKAGDFFFAHVANYFEADLRGIGITHADYRLDNLLFAPGVTSTTSRPTVVDWQTVQLGCPAGDIAYFLGSGLAVDDRRAHEFDIVKDYFTALSAHDTGGYSARDLEFEYRRGAWQGFVIGVGAAVLVERTERGDDMFLTMLHRHAHHALDLDADETIR